MDLFRMRCYVSVAENQSLSKAAHEQFITQPAMTAQMNALEKEFGIKLLDRGQHTVLTPAGEMVLNRFRDILAIYDQTVDEVRKQEDESYGLVRFGWHGPFNWLGVAEMVSEFCQEHSASSIRLTIDTWASLLKQVCAGDLDVAFMEMSEVEANDDLGRLDLLSEGISVIMPLNHRLAGCDRVSVGDLRTERLFMPDPDISPQFFKRLQKTFARAGIRIERACVGNHYEATVALVAAGNGLTCMPASMCRNFDSVVQVPVSDLGINMKYGVVWNRSTVGTIASELVAVISNWDWSFKGV